MTVEVQLFAGLQEGRFRRKKLEFPHGSTVADVFKHLAIGAEEVAILLVNNVTSRRDGPLKEGDVVAILPALSGG